jgi:predicted ribosome quality control (RQC) complex YloA/Tae2 family protein
MHNNYYFLRQLAGQLKSKVIGMHFEEAYTQSKDELTIRLGTVEKDFFIKAHLSGAFCCLYFPAAATRARKNSVDLFGQTLGRRVIDVVHLSNDRSFYLQMDNDQQMLFKMHGNRSNIVMFEQGNVMEIFRRNLTSDLRLDIDSMPKSVDTSVGNFQKQAGNYQAICPTFGKAFDKYFQNERYHTQNIEQQYQTFNKLLNYLEKPRFYLHISADDEPMLSLYQLHENDHQFEHPIEAVNALFRARMGDFRLAVEKRQAIQHLQKQVKKKTSYLNRAKEQLHKLQSADSYAYVADLIMANLNNIEAYSTTAVLTDFYDGKPVEVKLKSNLTPQLNAEKYYKKAKKQQLEISILERNIKEKQQEIDHLSHEMKSLEMVKKRKELRKAKTEKAMASEPPYYSTVFMNHEILIGKNAKKNEVLTFGVATKEDLFLHAKDSPGSHVIIKKKNNQNFPRPVIERAASYAAFYSKNKGESLVTVLYTPKKYVRKARGKPPGTVIVMKEKVILVNPINFKK